jgi:HPr kinase/phosphorylase
MTTILGLKIPVVTIPLIPGKNITVLAEVVAMNHQLHIHGIRSPEELSADLTRVMEGAKPGRP